MDLIYSSPTATTLPLENFNSIIGIVGTSVIDSRYAMPHEFPHLVHLSNNNVFHCGGTILSTLVILTAAHCVNSDFPNRYRVIAGDHDLNLSERTEQERNVSHIFVHEGYNSVTLENDIALLFLSNALEFNSFVQPIAYRKVPFKWSGFAKVAGWEFRDKSESLLEKMMVRILPDSDKEIGDVLEGSTFFGTGERIAKLLTDQGVTGGPLTCDLPSDTGIKEVCGILSQYENLSPRGIYTSVSYYGKWIEDIIKKYQFNEDKYRECSLDDFRCSSTQCINLKWRCDGVLDCANGLDEINCPSGVCGGIINGDSGEILLPNFLPTMQTLTKGFTRCIWTVKFSKKITISFTIDANELGINAANNSVITLTSLDSMIGDSSIIEPSVTIRDLSRKRDRIEVTGQIVFVTLIVKSPFTSPFLGSRIRFHFISGSDYADYRYSNPTFLESYNWDYGYPTAIFFESYNYDGSEGTLDYSPQISNDYQYSSYKFTTFTINQPIYLQSELSMNLTKLNTEGYDEYLSFFVPVYRMETDNHNYERRGRPETKNKFNSRGGQINEQLIKDQYCILIYKSVPLSSSSGFKLQWKQ